MEQIGKHTARWMKEKIATGRARGERAELIRYFLENANKQLINGRPPYSAAFIASRLSHLTITDLYAFKSQCEDRARTGYPWGKYFWGALKVR